MTELYSPIGSSVNKTTKLLLQKDCALLDHFRAQRPCRKKDPVLVLPPTWPSPSPASTSSKSTINPGSPPPPYLMISPPSTNLTYQVPPFPPLLRPSRAHPPLEPPPPLHPAFIPHLPRLADTAADTRGAPTRLHLRRFLRRGGRANTSDRGPGEWIAEADEIRRRGQGGRIGEW